MFGNHINVMRPIEVLEYAIIYMGLRPNSIGKYLGSIFEHVNRA